MRTSTGIRACKKRDSVLCLSVKNTGDFKINFKYDVLAKAEYGQVEREVIWAYETFGGKPQNSPFLTSILEQYLKLVIKKHVMNIYLIK